MRHIEAIIGASLLLAGCATATTSEAIHSPELAMPAGTGHPAAAYEVKIEADVVARVSVWMEGLYGDGQTYLSIATDIQNLGTRKLALDLSALKAQPLDAQGRPVGVPGLVVAERSGGDAGAVPSTSTRRFDFTFALPREVDPNVVATLRVTWGLVSSDGERYVQTTDFAAEAARPGIARAFVPVLGSYDPYFIVPRDVATRRATAKQVVMPSRVHPQHD